MSGACIAEMLVELGSCLEVKVSEQVIAWCPARTVKTLSTYPCGLGFLQGILGDEVQKPLPHLHGKVEQFVKVNSTVGELPEGALLAHLRHLLSRQRLVVRHGNF